MKAALLLRERVMLRERAVLRARSFVELRIWRVPEPVCGSRYPFEYPLAHDVDRVCLPRYDEAGKGDHKNVGDAECPYGFTTPEQLLTECRNDVDRWRR